MDEFEFDDCPDRVDRGWLWRVLSTRVYRARNRSRDMRDTQLDSAWRVVGVYERATLIAPSPGRGAPSRTRRTNYPQ